MKQIYNQGASIFRSEFYYNLIMGQNFLTKTVSNETGNMLCLDVKVDMKSTMMQLCNSLMIEKDPTNIKQHLENFITTILEAKYNKHAGKYPNAFKPFSTKKIFTDL